MKWYTGTWTRFTGGVPKLIILDEAQRIKNWKTRRAQTIKRLNSDYAIVLTGTPLENRLGRNSIRSWSSSIASAWDRCSGFLPSISTWTRTAGSSVTGTWTRSGETLAPILLRRTKKEVLKQLPERLDKNYFVPMTKEQMAHHAENAEIVARIVAKWRRFGFLSEADQRRLMIALQNMRMSCNSTYLLDKKTDFGFKADELLSVLRESFEQPGDKAVVFSQWVRTHELIVNRLEAAKLGHVLFHGGVDSKERRDLITQFKQDPQCRIFLSTDAGGVGLNLQNASMVVNMDLPWNPAVLDQRVGRVHRLGQHRPVRVVNFVAQGTIEHGMLSVLAFKQIHVRGCSGRRHERGLSRRDRLKHFMDSVDQVTQSIPVAMPPEETMEPEPDRMTEEAVVAPATSAGPDWGNLISAGLTLLNRLGRGLSSEAKSPTEIVAGLKIERDESTGQRLLKLPVPSKEVLHDLASFLSQLAEKL